MPRGKPIAIAALVEMMTSSTCCATSDASSARCESQNATSLVTTRYRRNGVQQTANARIVGPRNLVRQSEGDKSPAVEHANARRQRKRLAHVVRDNDHCSTES